MKAACPSFFAPPLPWGSQVPPTHPPTHSAPGQCVLRRLGPSLPASPARISPPCSSPWGPTLGWALWRPCLVLRFLLAPNFDDAPSLDFRAPLSSPSPCSPASQGLPCLQLHLVQPVPAPEPSWGTGCSSTQQTGRQGAQACWPLSRQAGTGRGAAACTAWTLQVGPRQA